MNRRLSAMPATGLALSGMVTVAQAATDNIAGNYALSSQYVFRGLTQTNERPAVQGGLDLSQPSGVYVGTWVSNVSWLSDTNAGTSNSLEWDIYGGYRRPFGDVTLDVGVLRYQYPGHYPRLAPGTVKPHTTEVYAGATWKWLVARYSYAVSDTFGVEDSKGTDYIDVSVTVPMNARLSVLAHVGRQGFSGASTAARAAGTTNDALYTYTDWRAGLSWVFAPKWTASITYCDTNARDGGYTMQGSNLGDAHVIAGVTASF